MMKVGHVYILFPVNIQKNTLKAFQEFILHFYLGYYALYQDPPKVSRDEGSSCLHFDPNEHPEKYFESISRIYTTFLSRV